MSEQVGKHFDLTYRELKEKFVSNLNGTSVAEVTLVASNAPIAVLANIVVCQVLLKGRCYSPGWKFLVDFVTLIMPSILLATVLSDCIELAYCGILTLTIALLFYQSKQAGDKRYAGLSTSNLWNVALTGKRPFITCFRSYVLIATAVCILAVDFTAFPRRFGKVETYGTGFMDAGVGAFVMSNAIVSSEARGRYPKHRGFTDRMSSIMKSFRSCIPLLVIGAARTVSVKATDYQEHVSEYGVHWNFFFTLAAVKVLSTTILCLWDPSWSWLISIAVASGHQYLLQGKGLKRYILHGPDGQGSRNNLISANREGLFSCLGYISIYFAGVHVGQYLFQPRVKLKEWLNVLRVLTLSVVCFWSLLNFAEENVEPISRRMANLTFIVWMMVYNLQLLAAFLFVDLLSVILTETGLFAASVQKSHKDVAVFSLLEAVNRNGLWYFLLANLLTGAVNFSIQTLQTPVVMSVFILIGYMFTLSAVIALLHLWNVTLRFW